jgi:hypothetical protein
MLSVVVPMSEKDEDDMTVARQAYAAIVSVLQAEGEIA